MDPIATETTETPVVVESKVTEKVVEDVEPVVASGDDTETAPVEDAPAPVVETTETPAVESSEVVPEVTENGNKEAEAVKPVEEAEESVKRKVVDDEAPEVPEKRVKSDEVETVEADEPEVTA